MIKVNLHDKNKIVITGHADYDDVGKDIVCACVSSVVITSINAIIDIDPDSILYEDLNNKLSIEVKKDNDTINKLINNMIFMLECLEKDYPKNIKILRR